mmetsp:Transcript_522/g.1072  ORF Transcript_522/g.1072 Transcript_522/m.1072 type:complete len:285 (-) Transcript_522:255-1109(-)
MSLQLVHRLRSVLTMNEGHERKATRLQGHLILGEVNARNPSKRLEQILQIRFRRIFRNVGDANGVLIAVIVVRLASRFARRGCRESREGFPSQSGSGGSSPGAWRDVLSSCPTSGSSRPARSPHLSPPIRRIRVHLLIRLIRIHIVLPLQIPHVLLGPKRVQIPRNRLPHVLLLQVHIGPRILHVDVVPTLNRHVGLILVDGRLSELLPLATGGHRAVFADLVVRHADFRDGFEEAIGVGGVGAIGRDDFDAFFVDAGGVGGGDGEAGGGGGGGGFGSGGGGGS